MTSDDGSNGSNQKLDGLRKTVREREEEAAIVDRFLMLARSKLHDVSDMLENGSPRHPSQYKLGDKEQREILSITGMGLAEGILAGVVTFAVLRRGPIYIGRYVTRRRQAQSMSNTSLGDSGYKLSTPDAPGFDPYKINPKWPRPKSLFLRGIWFCFDATISIMMAASVSMQLSSAQRVKSKIADLPLVEGRSLASMALCGVISDELKRLHREQSPAYRRLQKRIKSDDTDSSSAVYLDGIIQFVENCERRESMEERLRLSRGLSKDEPVDIPPPGVPRNEPRLRVWHEHLDERNLTDPELLAESWVDQLTNDDHWDGSDSK